MAKGLEMYSAMVLQLLRENVPGEFNPGGERRAMTSMRVEQQPDSAWENFKPQGANSRIWNAIVRENEVLSGPVRLDFDQIDVIFDLLCGAPVERTVNAGAETLVWELVDSGAVDRQLYSAQYGPREAMQRITKLLLMSLSLNFMRMTENNEGAISLVGRKLSEDLYPYVGLTAEPAEHVITFTDVDGPVNVTATNADGTALGTFVITPGDLEAAVQTAARAIGGAWADVTVTGASGAAPDSDGAYTFAFVDDEYVPQPTTDNAGAAVTSTSGGSAGGVVIPKGFPILPQMWTLRRADTLAGLDAAVPIKRASGFTMEFPDQINLLWHLAGEDDEVNEVGFTDWVDAEYDLKMRITVANSTPDCIDILEGAKELPSRAQWWRAKAVHPDAVRSLQVDGYWAVESNISYANENNVRYREFPFNVQLNDEGFAVRFTLTRPV